MNDQAQQQSLPRKDIWATFAGAVDQEAVKRVFQGASVIAANQFTHVHLLFQSAGGTVGDGVCLYNFFKALPFHLTIYNSGMVSSIASIAYLGAHVRIVSAHATFMIHRTTMSPQFAGGGALQAFAQGVVLDDARTEAILKSHVNFDQETWAKLNSGDLFFSAEEAIKTGVAQQKGDFAPPLGTHLYAI
jgi:ATP-dependent Clp protease, protease subunit